MRYNRIVNKIKGDVIIMLEEYDTVLTISDLREILNVGRNSVYDLLKEGAIPSFRIGRSWKVPKEALIHYLNQWKSSSVGA